MPDQPIVCRVNPDPIPLTGGDCFLLARGTSIVLRDSPRTRPKWSFREIGARANGNVALCGGGGAPTTIVCGSLSFDRASLKPIAQLLPSFILMKADEALWHDGPTTWLPKR